MATLAPDTVRTIRRSLSKILSTAMEWSYVDENVTRGIRLLAPRRREQPFLTPEQFQNLLAGLPKKVRVMILLVMMTSMRVCEILAHRWRRVDLRTGTLRITERFYRGDFSTVGAQREAVERLERFLLFPSCSQIVAEPVGGYWTQIGPKF